MSRRQRKKSIDSADIVVFYFSFFSAGGFWMFETTSHVLLWLTDCGQEVETQQPPSHVSSSIRRRRSHSRLSVDFSRLLMRMIRAPQPQPPHCLPGRFPPFSSE